MEPRNDDAAWRDNPAYLRAAAWVPDRDEELEQWEALEQLAVDWIEERAVVEGASPTVLLAAAKALGGTGPVQSLAARVGFTYPRDREQLSPGPTLVYHPDAQMLTQARRLARGYSLVAVETAGMPLPGWALGTGAVDLTRPGLPPRQMSPELRQSLDHTIFFTGNNNWTGPHEREDARRSLRSHVKAGLVDTDIAIGYALAHGRVTELGAKNLRNIIDGLRR